MHGKSPFLLRLRPANRRSLALVLWKTEGNEVGASLDQTIGKELIDQTGIRSIEMLKAVSRISLFMVNSKLGCG